MPSAPEKIAIPQFRGAVAPCFGYSLTIELITARDRQVLSRDRFTFSSDRAFDRIRLLRDQGVDTLICGGIQCAVETMVRASGIRVVAWVSGAVEEVLDRYLRGELCDQLSIETATDAEASRAPDGGASAEPDGQTSPGVRKP